MCKIKGISSAKVAQIKDALEVENCMASKPTSFKVRIKPSQAFVDWFPVFLRKLKKENVKTAHLDPKLEFYKNLTTSQGSLSDRIINPIEETTPSQKAYETNHRLN